MPPHFFSSKPRMLEVLEADCYDDKIIIRYKKDNIPDWLEAGRPFVLMEAKAFDDYHTDRKSMFLLGAIFGSISIIVIWAISILQNLPKGH